MQPGTTSREGGEQPVYVVSTGPYEIRRAAKDPNTARHLAAMTAQLWGMEWVDLIHPDGLRERIYARPPRWNRD